MNSTDRLRHRAPTFHGRLSGGPDEVRVGTERALRFATERARQTGQRQVVTVSPYSRIRNEGGPSMRVQAWR